MTTEPEPTGIGEVLDGAVPPLPEPEDRIAEVRARVRRGRLRTGVLAAAGGVVAVVAVALAVPAVVAGTGGGDPGPAASGLDAGDCPPPVDLHDQAPGPSTEDQTGPLVPEEAVAVAHCEREVIYPGDPDGTGTEVSSRILAVEVGPLVDALNALPTEEEVLAELDPGIDLIACTAIGFPTSHALVFGYPDGGTVAVRWDPNCGTWTADGRVRHHGTAVAERYLGWQGP